MDLVMRTGGAAAFFDDEDAAESLDDAFARDLILGGTQFRCRWEAELSHGIRRSFTLLTTCPDFRPCRLHTTLSQVRTGA